MKYLLDVNALLAAIVNVHPNHVVADQWVQHKELVVCPLSELGFLRISTHPKAYNFGIATARRALQDFVTTHRVEFLAADLSALKATAARSNAVTDNYLAELANLHNLKLATFDVGIKHRAVQLIS